jgi:hypothetical protein
LGDAGHGRGEGIKVESGWFVVVGIGDDGGGNERLHRRTVGLGGQ